METTFERGILELQIPAFFTKKKIHIMTTQTDRSRQENIFNQLPRNVWVVSLTSFFMDISSEMVINVLPLFLSNVLGVHTSVIGLIEGLAEATSSLLKVFSGWFSDKLRARKWLAVVGYALSTVVKPFFYIADSWYLIALVRWTDRIGKGIRTAPRDALVADSVPEKIRGLAFGFQRAADTAGATIGLVVALGVVWLMQSSALDLGARTFRTVVLVSIVPALIAVLILVLGARDVSVNLIRKPPKFAILSLGKPFLVFLIIVGLFELGNSSDAFLVLRAQERGSSVIAILIMLIFFNLVYSLTATPAGILSDRIGRRKVIVYGWLIYSATYLGFGLARHTWHIIIFYILYGFYYGLAYGTSKALIAELVGESVRGIAYGTYSAIIGLLDLPASLIAGLLWQGIGHWSGMGAQSPFIFGAITALLAALLMVIWLPGVMAKNPIKSYAA